MSGVEIALPVIAAVFALVSAFKDGGTIAVKLNERRQRRNAQPPNERLIKELEQGVQQVVTSEREGFEDFGRDYQADAATASKIKDVTIVLQDTIIRELAAAYQNDDMTDFTPAINSIIQARREAVGILNNHYLSLQKRQAQGLPLQSRSTSPSRNTVLDNGLPGARAPQQHTRTNTLDTTATGTPHIVEPHPPPRSTSRSNSTVLDAASTSPQSPQAKPKSGIRGLFGRRPSTSVTPKQNQPQTQSPPPSNVTSPAEVQRNASIALPSSPPPSVGLPSPALQRSSTMVSILEPTHGAMDIVPICEENKFAGLCKCAYRAQNYKFSKAMEPSMREYEWMYHCKKCKFRLTADSSQRGSPHFDDRIQTSVSTINFRCMFLFKSHVAVKDGSIRQYSCLLCLLSGRKSKLYAGEDQLFGHIVRHTGEVMIMHDGRQVALQGMIEMHSDGISSASIESFDIYFPLELHHTTGHARQPSFSLLPESAMRVMSEVDDAEFDTTRLSLSPSTYMSGADRRRGSINNNTNRPDSRFDQRSIGTAPSPIHRPLSLSSPSPLLETQNNESSNAFLRSSPRATSPSEFQWSELPASRSPPRASPSNPHFWSELPASSSSSPPTRQTNFQQRNSLISNSTSTRYHELDATPQH